METDIYSQKAEKIGTMELPENLFGVKWNRALVWQVVESERANLRKGLAHAKDRSEVSGGGKKPWRQKGTGRARHGSTRSPIWVGGGVAHGPRKNKIYSKKINQKMRILALAAVMSQKARDGEILILDNFSFPTGKTKDAHTVLKKLGDIKGYDGIGFHSSAAVALDGGDERTRLALRNLKHLSVLEARNLNVLDALSSRHIIMPKSSIEALERRIKNKI